LLLFLFLNGKVFSSLSECECSDLLGTTTVLVVSHTSVPDLLVSDSTKDRRLEVSGVFLGLFYLSLNLVTRLGINIESLLLSLLGDEVGLSSLFIDD